MFHLMLMKVEAQRDLGQLKTLIQEAGGTDFADVTLEMVERFRLRRAELEGKL